MHIKDCVGTCLLMHVSALWAKVYVCQRCVGTCLCMLDLCTRVHACQCFVDTCSCMLALFRHLSSMSAHFKHVSVVWLLTVVRLSFIYFQNLQLLPAHKRGLVQCIDFVTYCFVNLSDPLEKYNAFRSPVKDY